METPVHQSPEIPVRNTTVTVAASAAPHVSEEMAREVNYILADCALALGQSIGMRMTIDYEAVKFAREHFRTKFLAAMRAFGNRWLEDRQIVTGVVMMLGERAVRYADGRDSIDLESVRKAAADVERYCTLHARRASREAGPAHEGGLARIAGYWCTDDEP